MEINIIKTEEDYRIKLARLKELFHAEPGTSEGDELELLCMAVGKYEDEHYHIEDSDPVEAIKFRLDQMNTGNISS